MTPESDFSKLKEFIIRTPLNHDLIFFCHALFAFIFYSNYFLFNQPLVCSTDSLLINFPLLLVAKHNFWEGSLGIWNPYLLNGISTFSSSNAPIFSPDNWLLFLFPDKYFFLAGTFFSFIKMWLIGVFSYLVFKEELQNEKWAFFASLVYQLSGYTVWATMIFDVLSMYLFTTIAIYLIWTLHRRKQYANFILVTLVLLVNMLSTNISYASYSMILIGVLFLYRFISENKTLLQLKHFTSFSLGFVASLGLHLFRILSVFGATHDSNKSFAFVPDLKDTSFLLLRLFNPEILGVNYRNSMEIFPSLSPQFEGWHIQWAMPLFFGVLPALLVVWAIISLQKGRVIFWTLYVPIVASFIAFIEPIDTLLRIINPVYHTLSLQIFLPIGFAFLAGYTGHNLEKEEHNINSSTKLAIMLLLIVLLIFFYNLTIIITGHAQDHVPAIRIGFFIALPIVLALSYLIQKKPVFGKQLHRLIILIATLGFLALVIFFKHPNTNYVFLIKLLSVSLLALISIYTIITTNILTNLPNNYFWIITGLVIGTWFFALLFPWTDQIRNLPSKNETAILSSLGVIRYSIITSIFLFVLYKLKKKQLNRKWIFPICMIVFLFDQVPTSKIHSHIVMNPFYKYSNPFPSPRTYLDKNGNPIHLDTQNYRVNSPNAMLSLPIYSELYGQTEILSSIHGIYKIRSYGGYYNIVSNRYKNFIFGIVPDLEPGLFGIGLYEKIKNDRFLDLSGVGYAYHPETQEIEMRPNALSRVMLFQSYEVIPDKDQALPRLRSAEFDPKQTIVLNKDPGLPNENKMSPGQKLEYRSHGPDEIEVHTQSPGILFFGDSFHEGWNAYVDGEVTEILTGDYNFMAVAVPHGTHEIRLVFEPRYFYLGVKVGMVSGIAGIFIAMFLFVFRKRIDPDLQPANS